MTGAPGQSPSGRPEATDLGIPGYWDAGACPRCGLALDVWPCNICRRSLGGWTGHGFFCQSCRDRAVQRFRAGILGDPDAA
jgi:hypothetical protein